MSHKIKPFGVPLSDGAMAFWTTPSLPQFRKVVGGKERRLDGTETKDTKIVKYDYNPTYREWLEGMVKSKL